MMAQLDLPAQILLRVKGTAEDDDQALTLHRVSGICIGYHALLVSRSSGTLAIHPANCTELGGSLSPGQAGSLIMLSPSPSQNQPNVNESSMTQAHKVEGRQLSLTQL